MTSKGNHSRCFGHLEADRLGLRDPGNERPSKPLIILFTQLAVHRCRHELWFDS